MNKRLFAALQRCQNIKPQTLEEFLGDLIDQAPDQLAHLPGTPATVQAAQFTYYATTSAMLTEALRRKTTDAQKIADLVWRLSQRKEQSDNQSPSPRQNIRQPECPCHDSSIPCLATAG